MSVCAKLKTTHPCCFLPHQEQHCICFNTKVNLTTYALTTAMLYYRNISYSSAETVLHILTMSIVAILTTIHHKTALQSKVCVKFSCI